MSELTPPENIPIYRELDQRTNDGLTITLYWLEGTTETYVAVDDQKTGEYFSFQVPEDVKPQDAFNHAMVYKPGEENRGNIYASPEGS